MNILSEINRHEAHRQHRLPVWLSALVIVALSALCWGIAIGIVRALMLF
jgi:hypothetical protein